jgi:flagellar motility protein MotE (MotC chaperone)
MSRRITLFMGLLLAAGLACSWAIAQQPQQTQPVPPSPAVAPIAVSPGYATQNTYTLTQSSSMDPQAAKLAKQYAKAEKEDEKKEIRKKLSDLLAKQFDAQALRQQKELDELEKQIATLKTTLKKRQDSKTTIVERRMDQLIQEAEGMGWNVPSTPRAGGAGQALSTAAKMVEKMAGPEKKKRLP